MMNFSYTSDKLYEYCVQCHKYPTNKETMLWSYVGLIQGMSYELLASGQSRLLSLLCAGNQITCKLDCFSIAIDESEQLSDYSAWYTYDLYPIAQSILAFFAKSPDNLLQIYNRNTKFLFQQMQLGPSSKKIPDILRAIDSSIWELKGKAAANPQQIQDLVQRCDRQTAQIKSQEKQLAELKQQLAKQGQETRQEPLEEKPKPAALPKQTAQTDDSVSRLPFSERLKVLASSRQQEEDEILRKVQQLRNDLQSELQEITKIREGLEFETLQEPISQVLFIHGLLWDILESHPMDDVETGYDCLVDCCHDLQKNIVESLAMLGVTYINDTGVTYAPSMHRTAPGVQPTRNGVVSKVLRPGFSYRSKTLEKAIVELQ